MKFVIEDYFWNIYMYTIYILKYLFFILNIIVGILS